VGFQDRNRHNAVAAFWLEAESRLGDEIPANEVAIAGIST
jgi:hypothetical protein